MEVLGFIFGITALGLASSTLILALSALTKISALEKKLKGKGVLDKEFKSG